MVGPSRVAHSRIICRLPRVSSTEAELSPDLWSVARRLVRARPGLVEAQAAYGAAAVENQGAQRPTMRGFKIANAAAGQQVSTTQEVVRRLEAERDPTPNKVPLAQVRLEARLLETKRKLLAHAVRMSAYSESALARLLAPLYWARSADDGRALLREAFRDAGDLRCADGRLAVVHLNPLSARRRTRAVAGLCELLDDTNTAYLGTEMVIHYSVKNHPPLHQLSRYVSRSGGKSAQARERDLSVDSAGASGAPLCRPGEPPHPPR